MTAMTLAELLAQTPDSHVYIHLGKLATMVVLFAVWVLFAQWVDKDALVVNTWRVPWNLGVVSAGILGTVLMLIVPVFIGGLSAFVVLNAAALTAYIIHRNGLVTEETKVFTIGHFQRLFSQGFARKQKLAEVKEKVKIKDSKKKAVPIPEDPVARENYRLTQELLFDALWRRAGLVEVTPAGQASKIRYVIDGLPAEREGLPRNESDAILNYLKELAGLSLDEKRKPQSGRVYASVGETSVEIIVKTGGSTAGEKLTLQVIGKEAQFKVGDLGFTDEQTAILKDAMYGSKGLFVISGPRGSGVSTTFYSLARSNDAFMNNIQTLEVNLEYELENITRNIYKPAEEKAFATELQKIFRTDPDIVFIPDVRGDKDAAAVVSKASIDKQRVYVTVDAEDVFDAIRAWIAVANDRAAVSRSIKLVTNQRLVRVLCTECKQPYKPDQQTLRKANLPQDKVFYRPPEPQYDKHGNPIICQNCQGTGYVGRTGVFDVLVVDDGLREVIRRGGSVDDIRNYVLKKGAMGLQQQALTKVLSGVTSIQEVIRVTRKAPPPGTAADVTATSKPKAGPSSGPAVQPAR